MKIKLVLQSKTNNLMEKDSRIVEVQAGQEIQELVKVYQQDAPYSVLLAKVKGIDRELTYKFLPSDDNATVELLDARAHSADLTYKRSLSMVFLKAVRDVFDAKGHPEITARIDNTLNKGFFAKLAKVDMEGVEEVLPEFLYIDEIEARMKEIVEADYPIVMSFMEREEGIAFAKKEGRAKRAGLIESIHDLDYQARYYDVDGYKNYFFGPMLPSTGYVKWYQLVKYEEGLILRSPYCTKPDEIPEYHDDRSMYEAFEVERRWLEILKTPYVDDMNKAITNGKTKDLILLSEALHEKKISDIADEIKSRGRRIVLIAGPSSSGKTTFARRLCVQLRVNGLEPLYMGTDDYFVEREDTPKDENGDYNYENLDAMDIDLFNRNMNDLLAGKEVDLPEFDFVEGHKKFGRRITSINSDQPIVIEGIHALNGEMTRQIDEAEKYRIYISPLIQINMDLHNRISSTDGRMLRRIVRDYKYRGRTASTTLNDWPKVRAGEDQNIFPYNGEADVLFNSSLPYELPLLKKYIVPLLEAIEPGAPEYSEAIRMLYYLKYFRTIDEEHYVPNNSILREFIGGSVFVE